MMINTLEKKSWLDVNEQVRKVNSKLATVIDDLNVDPSFTFYKGTYSFGEEIIKKGHLQVSLADNHSISLDNPVVDKKLQADLGYNFGTSPVSLVLSGAVEAFLVIDGYTITLPAGVIYPGKVFGTWKVLNQDVTHMPAFIWSMTSGARSLFMLPKISKASSHKRLMKAFNLQHDTPKETLHHWHVFKEITNHQDFKQDWHSEIMV